MYAVRVCFLGYIFSIWKIVLRRGIRCLFRRLRRRFWGFWLSLLRIRRIRRRFWVMGDHILSRWIWRSLSLWSRVFLWWVISVLRNGRYGFRIVIEDLWKRRKRSPKWRKLLGNSSLLTFEQRMNKYLGRIVWRMELN